MSLLAKKIEIYIFFNKINISYNDHKLYSTLGVEGEEFTELCLRTDRTTKLCGNSSNLFLFLMVTRTKLTRPKITTTQLHIYTANSFLLSSSSTCGIMIKVDEVYSKRERQRMYERRCREKRLGRTVARQPKRLPVTDLDVICHKILDEGIQEMVNQGARMAEIDK